MTRGLLDDQFAALAEVEAVVEKLQPSFMAADTGWADLLDRAGDNLALQHQRLLEFYLQCFERENSIGDFRPDQEPPDAIVVLGANPPTLEKRVAQSVPVIRLFRHTLYQNRLDLVRKYFPLT